MIHCTSLSTQMRPDHAAEQHVKHWRPTIKACCYAVCKLHVPLQLKQHMVPVTMADMCPS
jgi:hypothetical protein